MSVSRCSGCGAALSGDSGACSFCGTGGPVAAVAAAPPTASDLRTERFARLRESRKFTLALAHEPTSTGPVSGFVMRIVIGLAFAGIATVMLNARGFREDRGAFTVIPVLFVLIGIGISIAAAMKWLSFAQARTETRPAIVVSKRIDVRGGKQSRTSYFVTFDFERGGRREYESQGSTYGMAREDDIGVAYLRSEYLLEFRAIDA